MTYATKSILVGMALLLGSMGAIAQKTNKDNPDYKWFYRDAVIETPEAIVTIVDVVSRMEYIKMKVRIQNKTSDFLLFKSWEAGIRYPEKTYHGSIKGGLLSPAQVIVGPNETDTKVIDIKGEGTNMNVNDFEFVLTGLYRVPASGTILPAPNFALPPKTNEVKAGTVYSCSMSKLVKETKVTEVTFLCKYTGHDIGMLQPVKAVAKLESGQEFATSNLKSRTYLMTPGDEDKMKIEFNIPGKIADMQFANFEILWKETFRESKATLLPEKSVKLTYDEGMSQGKNR